MPSYGPVPLKHAAICIGVVAVVVGGFLLVEIATTVAPSTGPALPALDGVAIVGHTWDTGTGPTIIASTPLPHYFEGWILAFVSYVNPSSPPAVVDVTGTVGGNYSLQYSTGLGGYSTEALYAATGVDTLATEVSVSATFSGDSVPPGATLAIVLVSTAIQGAASYVYTYGGVQSGSGGNATVGFATDPGGVAVLGVAGPETDAPFNSAAGETLLDTGHGTTGPGGVGVSFGTLAALASGAHVQLSAFPNAPGPWNAIGIELVLL
jgi:hypothetical protein